MRLIRTLLALLVFTSVGLGAELRTVSGKSYMGQLVAVTDKLVEFSTSAGDVKVPVADVLDISLQPVKGFAPDTKRMEAVDGRPMRDVHTSFMVLKDGKVIFDGTALELGRIQDPYIREYIA